MTSDPERFRAADSLPVELTELQARIEDLHTSSLMVNVDYLDLVDRFGEAQAWEILGKLKDLLG